VYGVGYHLRMRYFLRRERTPKENEKDGDNSGQQKHSLHVDTIQYLLSLIKMDTLNKLISVRMSSMHSHEHGPFAIVWPKLELMTILIESNFILSGKKSFTLFQYRYLLEYIFRV